MPEKKQETFTVTDRRLFTSEGEARETATEERSVSFGSGAGSSNEQCSSGREIHRERGPAA